MRVSFEGLHYRCQLEPGGETWERREYILRKNLPRDTVRFFLEGTRGKKGKKRSKKITKKKLTERGAERGGNEKLPD